MPIDLDRHVPTLPVRARILLRAIMVLVLLAAPVADARAQSTPDEIYAAGLQVRFVRYSLNQSGDGTIWFQMTNKGATNWQVAAIRCEIYDGRQNLVFERSFAVSTVVRRNTDMRETEGVVVTNFPRNTKPRCFVEKANRQ